MSETVTTEVTPELVGKAYGALMSGDIEEIRKYWAEDMVWLVPGHNQLSGWKFGLDGFLGFMGKVVELSGGSLHMATVTIMTNDDYSCDVTNNQGTRSHDPEPSPVTSTRLATWSRWRAMSGEMTTVGPSRTSAGSW